MAFELPKLPYEMAALEPFISKQTLEFHYGKHHRTYVDNLNRLVQGTPFENSSLEEIVRNAEGGIFNNGAQVWNHTFYWNSLSPEVDQQPPAILLKQLEASFGSFDAFKQAFTQAAATLFGSGWAWLVRHPDGKLSIVQESNAGNPLRRGLTPLLTCDVWEHAYYLDKQNRRPDYIADFWHLVNWKGVGEGL
ncbi:MAG TPA: superoxide dismutase [Bacteroidales bacterium]|nr:superoxide dismutase [Bacteroidales bacterium]